MPIPEDFQFPNEVDDVATLPAEAKALYAKNTEGKFTLDPVMKKRLDVSPLQTSLSKERKLREAHEKSIAGFKALGLGDTPEEALANIKKIEDGEDDETDEDGSVKKGGKKPDNKAMREKLKAEFEATLKQTVGEKDGELAKMKAGLRKHMVEREAIAALAKHKGSADLLLPHVLSKLNIVEDDAGDIHVRVIDDKGEPIGDGRGGYKSVDLFIQEMKADAKYKIAFEGSGKTGTGSKTGEKVLPGSVQGQRSAVDKISAGLQNIR